MYTVLEIGPISIGIFRHDLMRSSEAGTEERFEKNWDPNEQNSWSILILDPKIIQGYSTWYNIGILAKIPSCWKELYLLPRSSQDITTGPKIKNWVSLMPACNVSSSTSPIRSRWEIIRDKNWMNTWIRPAKSCMSNQRFRWFNGCRCFPNIFQNSGYSRRSNVEQPRNTVDDWTPLKSEAILSISIKYQSNSHQYSSMTFRYSRGRTSSRFWTKAGF